MAALTPEAVVTASRAWIGTPWHPQASLPGIGSDCSGLHRGIAAMLGIRWPVASEDHVQRMRAGDWHQHTQREYFLEMFEGTGVFLPVSRESMQPGDTLLFGFGKSPCCHAGILTTLVPEPHFIHAAMQRGVMQDVLAPLYSRIRYVLRPDYEGITLCPSA